MQTVFQLTVEQACLADEFKRASLQTIKMPVNWDVNTNKAGSSLQNFSSWRTRTGLQSFATTQHPATIIAVEIGPSSEGDISQWGKLLTSTLCYGSCSTREVHTDPKKMRTALRSHTLVTETSTEMPGQGDAFIEKLTGNVDLISHLT